MRMLYEERDRDEGRDMLEMETGVVYTRDGEVFVERMMVDIRKHFSSALSKTIHGNQYIGRGTI